MKSVGFIFALVILFSGHFSTISGEILTSDKHYSHPTSHSNIEAELNEAKITICHYPPGNPSNVQTIRISESAWPAHRAHGDSLGACNNSDDEDDEDGDEDGDGDDNDDDNDNDDNDDDGDDDDGHDDDDDSCEQGFTSNLSLVANTAFCYSYELAVNYNGNGSKELSHIAVELPCGSISTITNSMNWDIEANVTDPVTGLSGFKVEATDGFGGENGSASFTINFELCAENLDCACSLGEYESQVAYKAGQCVEYEEVVVSNPFECNGAITEDVRPVLECVSYDNNTDVYTAHFGYLNENSLAINIPAGSDNKFTPTPFDRGQTTTFLPGRHQDVFTVDFDGSNLVWTLASPNGSRRTSTASDNPAQRCEDDRCEPESITGGSIVFNGPYDPQGTNIIENTALPTSPFEGVDFEYIWMQSEVNVANTPGNPHWSPVADSENLTDLEVSGLTQTMYYVRCARIAGCEMYWGETNTVEVAVDPCQPGDIDGGSIVFNGPYDPQGTNIIENTALPTSPFEGVDFEYIWMQSEVNVANTPGNPHWSPVAGSENLTNLEVSGLTQTMYYVRCARIAGCEMYWGETNTVEVAVDPCQPEDINGGSIVFNGPYDPQGTNIIENTALPTSPFEGVDFEYLWMQSEVNVANTPGNPHWSPVAGSENLTDLEVSGLTQTMYYVRCARIAGCEMYWGETNTVEVAVDPCQPEDINGGSIVFNGPYDPQGTNIIENTALPTSPFEGVDFEYIWMQSEVNVANTPGNPHWSPVAGSENLTDLEVSGLTQTMYYVRCTRIAGCEMYWGETNTVEVVVPDRPTATISGGGEICPDETAIVSIDLTGTSPFTVVYTNGVENTEVNITSSAFNFEATEGTYSLVSVEDAFFTGTVSGEASVSYLETPTATISGNATICNGENATISVALTGTAPWTFVYTDGSVETEIISNESIATFEAGIGSYSLVSVTDANCEGSTSGTAFVTGSALPSATMSGTASICTGETATVSITLTGNAPWAVTYTDGTTETEVISTDNTYTFEASEGTYSLVSVTDANCSGNTSGEAIVTNYSTPSANIFGSTAICQGQTATVSIELTGAAPWTITYTDGTTETTVSSSSNVYNFTASAGTYSLVAVEDANCSGEVAGSATISTLEAPTASISGDANVCQGESASLTIDLTGTAPWSITYSDGTNETTVNSSASVYNFAASAGTYSLVSVEDANCSGEVAGSATISTFEAPTASISGGGNVCQGENASLTIDLTGAAPWTITYTDGTNETTVNSSSNVYNFAAGAGTYSLVTVEDAKCSGEVTGSATVSTFETPTASISGGGSVCPGETIELTIEMTGSAPWSVTYSDGTTETTINSTTNTFSLAAGEGNYTLLNVEDANCAGETFGSATVTNYNTPNASISGGGNVCEGESATINFSISGTGPFILVYTDGISNYTEIRSGNSFSIEVSNAGTYTLVSVSDANCFGTVSGSAEVSFAGGLEGEISLNATNCLGETLTLSSTIEGDSYTWSTNGSGRLDNVNQPMATYEPNARDEIVEFTLVVSNSCSSITRTASTEFINATANFEITPDPGRDAYLTDLEYTFTPNDLSADSYTWDFGDGNTSSAIIPLHTFSIAGTKDVRLTISKQGCSATFVKRISVESNTNLFIPNVISPTSSNPENSRVKIYGESISGDKFRFEIYNRWGLLVYETTDLSEAQSVGWDGRSNNEEKDNNVFTYIVRGEYTTGQEFERTGTITLVK